MIRSFLRLLLLAAGCLVLLETFLFIFHGFNYARASRAFCALIQHDEMPSAALDQSGNVIIS